MAAERDWRQCTRRIVLDTSYESYRAHLLAIAYLGIPARKELLKVSRTQRSLSSNSYLRQATRSAKQEYTSPQDLLLYERCNVTRREVIQRLSDMCHFDPIASSIVGNLCRSAPFFNLSKSEIERNRVESWEKEIDASIGADRPSLLDYTIWFDESVDPSLPLSEFLPSAPAHNTRIRASFRQWKESIAGTVLFPQIQENKTVSRETAYAYNEAVESTEGPYVDTRISSGLLERLYQESGIEIGGPAELRQAWKYNDLTPRTYFAQGGQAFHGSKYIREIANSLTNSFPGSHFISRFSIHDLPVEREDTVLIYDYSSFTSNLTELKYFLAALAEFTRDTEVMIVDSFAGILRVNLGDLIEEYNVSCNIQTPFSVARYMPDIPEHYRHNRAGLLGVYGNIAFSTVLHGLHACQLAGDQGNAKCVGDDVYGVYRLDPVYPYSRVVAAIESLGQIQRSKVKTWVYRDIEDEGDDNQAWPYTKRPLDRYQNRVVLDQGIFLPIVGRLVPIPDEIHNDPESLDSRVRLLISQSLSAIRQIKRLYPLPTSDQVGLFQQYLATLYSVIGLPQEGRLPFETFKIKGKVYSGLFVPNILDDVVSCDPWELLEARWESRSSAIVRIPIYREHKRPDLGRLFREGSLECHIDKRIAYLRLMSWVRSEPMFEERLLEYSEYKAMFERIFAGETSRVYNVEIVKGYPSWVEDLILV